MYNYMVCNQCMIDSNKRYAVTYKNNNKSFNIYRRKVYHNFKVPVSKENLDGSTALEFESMEIYLVSNSEQVMMYDSNTFREIGKIPVEIPIYVEK